MIDTHCHLDSKEFKDDLEDVIKRACEAGVEAFVVPSTEPANIAACRQLSQEYENVYWAIGIHPHNAKEFTPEVADKIQKELEQKDRKLVAIGEVGLDYYYDFSPREVQKEAFRTQIQFAKNFNLPVIIHNRDSSADLLSILEEEQDGRLRFVLHCFSESKEFMEKALELGGYVSFTGNITFKTNKLQDVVELVPDDRFFLETDAPFMAPVPYRGKRNEPSFLKLVAEKISEIKSISINKVIEMTTKNSCQFFKLLIISLLLLSPLMLKAQEDTTDEEIYEKPYKKFIGIGGELGFNTLVIFQSWNENGVVKERSSANEGKFLVGANITFSPVDWNILRLEWTYTFDRRKPDTLYPDLAYIYRTVNFTSLFLINPSMRVNFFGGAGLSYLFNSFNLGIPGRNPKESFRTSLGGNFTAGFIVNIPISKVGLITLTGEWLMIFDFNKTKNIYDVELKKQIDNSYYYYSQPRFNLTFYPEFLNKLK
jgi:TatD DNase family protein